MRETSEKIKRIRLHKLVGKIVYSSILATLIIVILINLNCAMKIQADQLNRQVVAEVEDD